uniref:Zinc binding alcohol dehydrogenase domain containing 2 n=1 Tax=Nephromyces sp. MMRI TaxID=2496275 RepID=A0A3S8V365_9APIC|nr:zinc binding alcohol dehydrogenase domain containing 2 [Nephromyces sp. MMRI]
MNKITKKVSDKMKSVLLKAHGGVEQLYLGEIPMCQLNHPSEVLIQTVSIGVNRMDLLQREGKYPVPQGESNILGVEVSGYIHESKSKLFSKGDRVMALVSGGAYSEFIVAPDTLCMKIPTGLSFEQAASIPENWITAYQLLHFIAKIKKGDKVLIHAAASGVGCAAIQLCKIAGASDIIVTSRSQHKLEEQLLAYL